MAAGDNARITPSSLIFTPVVPSASKKLHPRETFRTISGSEFKILRQGQRIFPTQCSLATRFMGYEIRILTRENHAGFFVSARDQ